MHTGDAIPVVAPTATLPEIIHEMSAKRLGLTTVQAEGKLLGVLSDGDLRRLFARSGPDAFHLTAAEILNPAPRTIAPTPLAIDALALMERHKITSLIVTAGRHARYFPARHPPPARPAGLTAGSAPAAGAGAIDYRRAREWIRTRAEGCSRGASVAIVVLLVAGVTLILLAGTHNLRHRQMVMQKAQQEEVNLTPGEFGGGTCRHRRRSDGEDDDGQGCTAVYAGGPRG